MVHVGTSELESELRCFEAHRAELVERARGKYALVKNDALIGTFDDQTRAIRAGYERFGNEPFLVKEISEVDLPLIISSYSLLEQPFTPSVHASRG